jgi:hypothetical protein
VINSCDDETAQGFLERVNKLKKVYDEMSEIYQQSKGDADIPLS